jgi:hypothetical protein
MMQKINKERRRSVIATPTRTSNKNKWQGAQENLNKKRTWHKAENGQDNH